MESHARDDAPSPSGQPLECVICSQVSHGYHFGILACRACAAFFRRTVAEKKVYKCRNNMSCEISKEQRNMCRACRFFKCEQKGMNKNDVQLNRDPIGRKGEASTSTASNSAEPLYDRVFDKPSMKNPIEIPTFVDIKPLLILERLKQGCQMYLYWQKSFRNQIASDQPFVYLTYENCDRLEKASIPLSLRMLKEFFYPFDKLDRTTKKHVLQSFHSKHQVTEALFQTYLHSATLPTHAWLIYHGFVLDETNMAEAFGNTLIKNELVKSMDSVITIMKKVRETFERLEIDEAERAAMSGLMLWQEVSNAQPMCKDAKEAQETIMQELQTHIIQKGAQQTTGSRIGSFMCIITDVENLSRMFSEQDMMAKIFDSKNTDIWDSLDY
uniref:Nuclear receptor domain-containing protein n=1 Tax=Panagrellus redivivus TaxID=6233 RepID=A0A7E4W587_PANRE